MKVLVLAGGTGTRLWPVSRIFNPKQFTKLKGMGKSAFQITVNEAHRSANAKDIFIVTNSEYKYFVLGQLGEIGLDIPEENILFEPSFKNTLHAVSLGIFEIAGRGYENDAVAVIPSNSVVSDYDELLDDFKYDSVELAQNYIITFGVKAGGAYIGYGYIETGKPVGEAFEAAAFVEKPDKKIAEEFIDKGYLYNSGILCFTPRVFLDELKKWEPELYGLFESGDLSRVYSSPVCSTVEKGILEKSSRLAVVPLDKEWANINEFSAFYGQYGEHRDEDGNISFANNENVFIDSTNNLVYSEDNKAIGFIGVENLVVIDQPDALLVCDNSETDRVRNVAEILKERGDSRAEYHTTCYRPWGSYAVLEEGDKYKIKRITVLPGKKLSHQLHYHRSEHWVVVSGTARVVKDGVEKIVCSGESIFLSTGEKHRLDNPGKMPLEVIEVQIGSYLEEDDIVRFEDEYGRS